MKKVTLILTMILALISNAQAGIVLAPSGKLHIISLEKVHTPPQFDLTSLREKIKAGQPFRDDVEQLVHARKLWIEMDRILDVAFIVDGDDKLQRTLEAGELSAKEVDPGGFTFGESEVDKIAERIYNQIVSSSSVADIDAINNVLYQIVEKAKMKQSFRAEAKELERIREIIHQAKIKAEEVLTDEELARLLEAARMTLAKAKEQVEEVIDSAHRRQTFGAMVYTGSEIISVKNMGYMRP